MVKRMLIDAARPGETRVALVDGNHLDDFDFETDDKRQLKGNVYLAKVTRVEPSLQAAFVEYGGNRHGFLAFSEIHPDYYRIPIADREALLAEVGADSADDPDEPEEPDLDVPEEPAEDEGQDGEEAAALTAEADETVSEEAPSDGEAAPAKPAKGQVVETVGGEDGDRSRRRMQNLRNRYRIQEVIKRRQILLVQVTKEERGNKGAALTTYLSLAGRYCVLMPNTPRGGGISRKIANPGDRRRMKQILESLGVPDGMAIILRTAGLERTKQEIRRDADYLMRLWDQIRETTLESAAPTLIHEEGNLIKRAIRDLHSKDNEEILVAGDEGYRNAKDFMRMLVPSHARRVKQFTNPTVPLFHRYRVEGQIEALHDPVVQLKSGGYIVINPTEALVSIDVNSGKSTRERNIEETAYRTNLEAAQEVGRQLRLRDLAGLIVIDFIDMDENRHNVAVERKIKEAMRLDRARVQIGRISHFGLLELSRQRLRPSLQELDYMICRHCAGIGQVRTLGSSARNILRGIEEEGISQRYAQLLVTAPSEVVLTLLNEQREALRDIEQRYQIKVIVGRDDELPIGGQKIEGLSPKAAADRLEVEGLAEEVEQDDNGPMDEDDEEAGGRKRRRRRSRRSRRGEEAEQDNQAEDEAEDSADSDAEDTAEPVAADAGDEADGGEETTRKRRRGRRGGRRRNNRAENGAPNSKDGADDEAVAAAGDVAASDAEPVAAEPEAAEEPKAKRGRDGKADAEAKPRTPRRPRRRKSAAAEAAPAEEEAAPAEAELVVEQGFAAAEPAEPFNGTNEPDAVTEPEAEPVAVAASPRLDSNELASDIPAKSARQADAVTADEESQPSRRGWWRRVLDG